VIQSDGPKSPDAGRGSRRRSQWLAAPEVDGWGSPATGDGDGTANSGRRPVPGRSLSMVVLIMLLVTMVLAIASTFTLG
jgi:hypothetical protein